MKVTLAIEGTESRNPKNRLTGKNTDQTFFEVLNDEAKTGKSNVSKVNNPAVEYIVQPGDNLSKIGKNYKIDPHKIAKANSLERPNLIFPGQKLLIPSEIEGKMQPVSLKKEIVASWYGEEHQNKTTASGQPFDMNRNTLAHRTLPFGTRVRLTNPENGKTVEGVINDRGPSKPSREVDVSYAMAKELGFVRKGVTKLEIEII
ncbi:MAG TPA: septal ring lytic transglycosylase RlpA family protein [Thermodesulfobacteriota bacterium]|nr:septal ring lytic transglycosylase RlpA family protein [Thermodesulfobacteriota bacterium]